MAAAEIDQSKLEELQGKVVADVGGAMGLLMAYMGDQTGIYRSLERVGPCGYRELAEVAGVDARYLLEWLSANAAAGYVTYDAQNETFSLSPEQAAIFSHEDEPTCMQGFFQAVVGQYATHDRALETFRSGAGRPWSDHHACCFCGTDRFFRPGYAANLLDHWIPALEGVEAKLERGGRIADIGCGLGSSTLLMAERFPRSTIHGFDFHEPSIEEARRRAREAGLTNAEFHVTTAQAFPEEGYDFACVFDALHDMGDPVGAARHVRESLNPDGTFMVVEPLAEDDLAGNLHVLAGIFYAFSTTVCVPTSRSQEVGLGLGAQAGEARLRKVLNDGGFSEVRRAAETPTNMVLEARI